MTSEMKRILAFLASSAMGCMDEPPIYGPLRLLEAVEKISRYALEYESDVPPGLEKIVEQIAADKTLCMTDPEKFEQLVNWVGIEMVSVI